MKPRDKLRGALAHREGGLPLDLGSTRMTGISLRAYTNFLAYKGWAGMDPQPQLRDVLQQLAAPAEPFLQALEVDTRGIFPGAPEAFSMRFAEQDGYTHTVDEWGLGWKKPEPGGLYFDLSSSPMDGPELLPEMLEGFAWPDPLDPGRTETLASQRDAALADGCGLVMHGMTSGVLEMALRLRGFENFFADMVCEPELAGRLLDVITDIKIAYWQSALARLSGQVDVAVEADDLGTQESLLISPQMYRALLKPRHMRLFAAIRRASPETRVFLHSCGAIRPLIPDLIEAGVDILNPVQISCAGMDAETLKRDFGRELVFWGGGVDTQAVLPRGTPAQVRDQVRRQIETLAPGGGFVFSAVHNIQADVPPENLEAMLAALDEYR